MIREATLADLECLVRMGRRFLTTTSYQDHIAENPEQMEKIARMVIESPDGVFLLATSQMSPSQIERVVGMIGIFCFPHFFSGERIASEVCWWVEPDYRKGGDALKLLHAAEVWAKQHGAMRMQVVAPTGDVAAIYVRLGYTQVENAYDRRLT